MLVHGAADRFIDPLWSQDYAQAFEEAGQPIEQALIARADHVFNGREPRSALLDCVTRFFATMVLEPAAVGSA